MNLKSNNSGDQTKKKHGVKFKDKGMKMKTAEHVKLNRSAQSMTKSKIKKGNTAMISATPNLVMRSDKMTKTNFEAHIKWTRGVCISLKMTTI